MLYRSANPTLSEASVRAATRSDSCYHETLFVTFGICGLYVQYLVRSVVASQSSQQAAPPFVYPLQLRRQFVRVEVHRYTWYQACTCLMLV